MLPQGDSLRFGFTAAEVVGLGRLAARTGTPGQEAALIAEALHDTDAIRRAVHFVLSRPGLFLNSSSDATLLPFILDAARQPIEAPTAAQMETDMATHGIEPLFVRDEMDDVRVG